MKAFLNRISYPVLIPVAVLLALMPVFPQPHAVEKIRMLANGSMHRPIDIIDLLMHLCPTFLLLWKWLVDKLNDHNKRLD